MEQLQRLHGVLPFSDASNGNGMWSKPTFKRKTKIVCTIGPSTDTKEMIWKLAEAGMNVARLNMSHGDHASHQKVIDLVKEYNAQSKDNVIAIMLDTKVCSYLNILFTLLKGFQLCSFINNDFMECDELNASVNFLLYSV